MLFNIILGIKSTPCFHCLKKKIKITYMQAYYYITSEGNYDKRLVFFCLIYLSVLIISIYTVKPLEVKHIRARKGTDRPTRDSDFVGPKSKTARSNPKTDIILKFDGKTYQAHKHVLREASELFQKVRLHAISQHSSYSEHVQNVRKYLLILYLKSVWKMHQNQYGTKSLRLLQCYTDVLWRLVLGVTV